MNLELFKPLFSLFKEQLLEGLQLRVVVKQVSVFVQVYAHLLVRVAEGDPDQVSEAELYVSVLLCLAVNLVQLVKVIIRDLAVDDLSLNSAVFVQKQGLEFGLLILHQGGEGFSFCLGLWEELFLIANEI